MKPNFTHLLFAVFIGLSFAGQSKDEWKSFNLAPDESVLQMVAYEKELYLFTDKRVRVLGEERDVEVSCAVNDLSVMNQEAFLATDCGAQRFDMETGQLQPISLIDFKVERICKDFMGVLWVEGKRRIWRFEDGELNQIKQITRCNDMAATPDGSIWFATSIGLIQLVQPMQTFGKTRTMANKAGWYHHEEEARKGFELPDSYVDRLFGHGETILWVKMDEMITIVDLATRAAASGHGHLPNLGIIGKRNNELYNIQYLPNQDYIIFSTEIGVLGMSKFELDKVNVRSHTSPNQEIFNTYGSNGLFLIDLNRTQELQIDFQADPIKGIVTDKKGNLYLYNNQGYRTMKKRTQKEVFPEIDKEQYQQFLQKQHIHFIQQTGR